MKRYEVLGCLLKKTFFLTGEFFLPHEGKIKTSRGRIICPNIILFCYGLTIRLLELSPLLTWTKPHNVHENYKMRTVLIELENRPH